jgi:hypothetical protein
MDIFQEEERVFPVVASKVSNCFGGKTMPVPVSQEAEDGKKGL